MHNLLPFPLPRLQTLGHSEVFQAVGNMPKSVLTPSVSTEDRPPCHHATMPPCHHHVQRRPGSCNLKPHPLQLPAAAIEVERSNHSGYNTCCHDDSNSPTRSIRKSRSADKALHQGSHLMCSCCPRSSSSGGNIRA
jgi:hypothetical protein